VQVRGIEDVDGRVKPAEGLWDDDGFVTGDSRAAAATVAGAGRETGKLLIRLRCFVTGTGRISIPDAAAGPK